jgi:hypothetical protein
MDFGNFIGGIGNFFGGLFGGNQDDPNKRKQQQQIQAPAPIQQPLQPSLSVGVAHPQTLIPPTPSATQAPIVGGVTMQKPQSNFFTDTAKNVGDFTAQANDALYGGLVRGGANIANSVATGFNQDETQKRTEDFMRSLGQSNANGQSNLADGTDKNSDAGRIGQAVGGTERLVAENVPLLAIPGIKALEGISTGAKIAANTGVGGVTGFAQGAAQDGSLKDDLVSGGIGGAAGGVLTAAAPLLPKLLSRFVNKSAPEDTAIASDLSTKVEQPAGNSVEPTPTEPSNPITSSPTTNKPEAITSANPDYVPPVTAQAPRPVEVPPTAPSVAPPEVGGVAPLRAAPIDPAIAANAPVKAAEDQAAAAQAALRNTETKAPAPIAEPVAAQAELPAAAKEQALAEAQTPPPQATRELTSNKPVENGDTTLRSEKVDLGIDDGSKTIHTIDAQKELTKAGYSKDEINQVLNLNKKQMTFNKINLEDRLHKFDVDNAVISKDAPVDEVMSKIGIKEDDSSDIMMSKLDSALENGKITNDQHSEIDDLIQTEGEATGESIASKAEKEQPVIDDSIEKNPNAVGNLPDRQKLFSSKEQAIRNTKTDSGTELADKMVSADARHNELRAKFMYDLKPVFDLSKKDFRNAWDVQEGKLDVNSVSPAAADGAKTLKSVMPDIQKTASNADVIEGNLGDTYMPHIFKKGNNAPTVNMPTSINTNAKKFGNLETERLSTAQDYERTPNALMDYIDKASKRIGQSENFGSKNEGAKTLLGKIGAEGGDQGTATEAFQNYMRTEFPNTTAAKIGRGVRSAFGVARLPTAAISHLGQTSNTVVDAGIGNTLKGWAGHLSRDPESADFIERTGVNNPQSLGHYQNDYTSVKGIASKLTAPGLTPVMKMNRSVTALAYREYGNALAKAGNVEKLQALGVKGDIGATLTDDQALQVARGGVQKTMFSGSNAQTPIKAETTAGRFVGQYRTAYAYPQTKFIVNSVLKEAGKGNLAPLARYLTVSAGVSGATIATKNAISGRQEAPGDVALDVASGLGGLPGEIAGGALRYGARDVVGTAAGAIAPAAGEAVKFGTALQQSIAAKNPTAVERYGLKLIPGVGRRIAAAVVPTKAQQSAASSPTPQGSGNPITDIANGVGSFINGIFHPAPPDPLSAEMSRLETANKSKFSLALNDASKTSDTGVTAHQVLSNATYQAADDKTKEQMLKSVLNETATKAISDNLPDDQKKILLDAKLMGSGKLDVFNQDNGNKLNYVKATIANGLANGDLNKTSPDLNIAKKGSLAQQVAIAQVNSDKNVTQDVIQSYADTKKAEFNQLVKDGDPQAEVLAGYDKALIAAGLPAKFTNKNGGYGSTAKAKGGASSSFVSAQLPSSLVGTGATGASKNGYASDAPLFKPIASLSAPASVAIPQGRSISVAKGVH